MDYNSIPIGVTIPPNLIDSLIGMILDEEIKLAIFSTSNGFFLGLMDSLLSTFYKYSWQIIGPSVCKAIKSFFKNSYLPKCVKATVISLIPKSSHHDSLNNFRLISPCNSLYKIIAKILALRVKPVMEHIINESQAGFINGH